MRSRWNLPIYVAYVLLCLTVLGVIVRQIGVSAPWQHQRQVTAIFHSGDGILANNEVYLNGVKVGRVESVEARNGKAVVAMVIEDGSAGPLYADASADIRKKNLLGETYVDLHRGGTQSRDPLNGDITTTLSPVDIDQVLAILDPQTRQRVQLLINGAGDATRNAGSAMNESAGTLNSLVTSLNGPAAELQARQQQVEAIIQELEQLYTTLAHQRDQVRAETVTWAQVMTQLAAQDQAIGGTLQQADTLLQNTDTLLTGEVPNLQAMLGLLPNSLLQTQSFLHESSDILGSIAPYRRQIHDVFLDLSTTFSDIDANSPLDPVTGQHQHLWSVYQVSCSSNCSNTGSSTPQGTAAAAPNATWAAAMGTGG